MPIEIDEFEASDTAESNGTNAERVGRFLLRNRDKAFTAREIAERTDVDPNSIHPVLGRLADRGLVRHKRPYWAIGDVEDVKSALAYHETAKFLDEKLGSERRSDWVDDADESGE